MLLDNFKFMKEGRAIKRAINTFAREPVQLVPDVRYGIGDWFGLVVLEFERVPPGILKCLSNFEFEEFESLKIQQNLRSQFQQPLEPMLNKLFDHIEL